MDSLISKLLYFTEKNLDRNFYRSVRWNPILKEVPKNNDHIQLPDERIDEIPEELTNPAEREDDEKDSGFDDIMCRWYATLLRESKEVPSLKQIILDKIVKEKNLSVADFEYLEYPSDIVKLVENALVRKAFQLLKLLVNERERRRINDISYNAVYQRIENDINATVKRIDKEPWIDLFPKLLQIAHFKNKLGEDEPQLLTYEDLDPHGFELGLMMTGDIVTRLHEDEETFPERLEYWTQQKSNIEEIKADIQETLDDTLLQNPVIAELLA